MEQLARRVWEAGVVGAGGAGFPTHLKLRGPLEWVVANGAECEPLLHKDRELMRHHAPEILEGLRLAAAAAGATRSAVGVKAKNRAAVEALAKAGCQKEGAAAGAAPILVEFGDFYPSGDEYEVVYRVTGRLIPPGGIPPAVGVLVQNVETLYNVARAAAGIPVTHTLLTVCGLVREPLTAWFPVGVAMSDVLAVAGGPTVPDPVVLESGVMMGRVVSDPSAPVTKTTSGLVVLSRRHKVARRYLTPPAAQRRIGKSACDQCSYCTELCPRYLLGYDVQPHAVMRSLGFTASGAKLWNRFAQLCCGCGICTLYACPEDLFPREACLEAIRDLREAGVTQPLQQEPPRVHPMKEFRRVPMEQLLRRLDLVDLEREAPLQDVEVRPRTVRIPLRQHAGVPARPVVSVGDRVKPGQLIGDLPPEERGARVHASIAGRVTRVGEFVEIEATKGAV
ncbi:MAG: 4Fe-4S dicluster domain-containing protein [Acidobacteriota bacterium]